MSDGAIGAELLDGQQPCYPGAQAGGQRVVDLGGQFARLLPSLKPQARAKPVRRPDLKILVPSVCLILAFVIYTLVDAFGSGTQTSMHKLRIRNDTSFVLANGSDFEGRISLQGSGSDFQRRFDITHFPPLDYSDFYMTATPLGIVFDLPRNPNLGLELLYRKVPTQADFGGKMNIIVKNPRRRRMYFEELWFNAGYWKDSDMVRDFEPVPDKIVLGEFKSQEGKVYVPSAFSNETITPTWVIDFSALKDGEDLIQMHPDGLVFNLNPLLVRNFFGKKVSLLSTQFEGILAIESAGPLEIETNHCNVSQMMVNQDQAINLRNYSNISQTFRKQGSLFGITGQFDAEFYQREFSISQSGEVAIKVSSDLPMDTSESENVIQLKSKYQD